MKRAIRIVPLFIFVFGVSGWAQTGFSTSKRKTLPSSAMKGLAEKELKISESSSKASDPKASEKSLEASVLPEKPERIQKTGGTELGLLWQRIHPEGTAPFIGQEVYDLSKTGGSHLFWLEMAQKVSEWGPAWRWGGAGSFGYSTQKFKVQSSKGFLIPDVRLSLLLAEIKPYVEYSILGSSRWTVLAHATGGAVIFSQSDQNNVSNWSSIRGIAGGGLGVKWAIFPFFYLKAAYESRFFFAGTETASLDTHNFLLGAGVRW